MSRKKRLIILILFIPMAISISMFYVYHKISEGVPIIEVIPISYDFGDIPPELVKHNFIVKNIGNARLKINGISTSCGCTKAYIDSEDLLPDQEANLSVTFDPNSMSQSIKGEVYRIVYIRSNDPEQPEIELKIKANIVENIGK